MSACWMFIMILMGCRSSRATQSTCVCNDEPKPVCVPPGADVYVPCPNVTADEVKFSLVLGEEMISNHSCSHGEACMPSTARVVWELYKNRENNSVGFRLTKVNATSSGTYRCDGTVMFPPPLKTVHSSRILVLVEGHQCKKACSNVTIAAEPHREFHWIWVSGITSMYSIIVTIVAVVMWVKLRKTDSQSDYMNTKPRATRDRKKTRQNPILPRHF